MASINHRGVPALRTLDPDLRRRRLVAARRYSPRSVPRIAILLGQWDSGEVVRLGAVPAKRKRRKVKHG